MSTTASRRASIADVAQRAGVAVGTVSNVLNRPELVTSATADRVRAAIEALSFVPNGSARRLRAGTLTTVGLVVLDIRNPFFTDMARGVEDRLALVDHTLMLASSDDDPVREARYLRLFEEHGVSGMLVVPVADDLAPVHTLVSRGMNVVLLDAASPLPDLSSVSVDDVAGGKQAGVHLLTLGHRRITMLNGSHSIRQCRDRLIGLRAAVSDAGLDPDVVVGEVQLPRLNADAGAEAMARLLADDRPPRAVFAVNDLVAVGVQREVRGLRPDLLGHLAIVGYDDIEIAAELAWPLTSVRQPTYQVGYEAAGLLLERDASGEPVHRHELFQPELVVRATSVAAEP